MCYDSDRAVKEIVKGVSIWKKRRAHFYSNLGEGEEEKDIPSEK